MTALAAEECDAFVEIGPGSTLLGLGRPLTADDNKVWAPSIRRSRPDCEQVAETLAALWTAGVPIDWHAYDAQRSRRGVSLPTYPFERQRYWPDFAAPSIASGRLHRDRGQAGGLGGSHLQPDDRRRVDAVDRPSSRRRFACHAGRRTDRSRIGRGRDALGSADVSVEDVKFVAPVRFDGPSSGARCRRSCTWARAVAPPSRSSAAMPRRRQAAGPCMRLEPWRRRPCAGSGMWTSFAVACRRARMSTRSIASCRAPTSISAPRVADCAVSGPDRARRWPKSGRIGRCARRPG